MIKVWGWDIEQSAEEDDGKDYLQFSVDFDVPGIGKRRFYFQAKQQVDRNKVVSIGDGIVSVKQDVVQSKTAGILRFLSPKGILAQFSYVGNFVAKPCNKNQGT